MTIALVHGNPEVAAIWDDLIAALGRDGVVTLSPPGFGAPVPDGFGSTAPEYAAWLVGELEQLDGPIDLIGHDWGGGHVIGAATLRPDLLHSVTTDIAGCFAAGYSWHDLAQTWRTPGDGEAAVAAMAAIPVDDRTALFAGLGMSDAAALACAAAVPAMGPSVLALYRSAPEAEMQAIGERFAATADRPRTHVIIALDDGYTGGEALARRTAESWGATTHVLDGLGHWWMMQAPQRAAEMIARIVA